MGEDITFSVFFFLIIFLIFWGRCETKSVHYFFFKLQINLLGGEQVSQSIAVKAKEMLNG